MNDIKRLEIKNLDKVDGDTLLIAKTLVEKGLIKLDYSSNKEIIARFPYKICELGTKGSDYFINNLLNFTKNNNQCFLKKINLAKVYDLTLPCMNKKCNFNTCPLMVASYFQNLCDDDQTLEENINNIDCIKTEQELLDLIDSIIGQDDLKEDLRHLVKVYKKRKINGSVNEDKFYNNFALIGNDGLEQDKIVKIIKYILISNQVLDDNQYQEFYTLDMDFDKKINLSDYENEIKNHIKYGINYKKDKIDGKLIDYKLIYLKDFGKILDLKTRKEDFYYKLINTIKKLILDDSTPKTFIISGTKENLKLIFNENSELASLFGYKWNLEDYNIDILTNQVFDKLQNSKIGIEIDKETLKSKINILYRESNFKNSYFIDEIYQKTIKNYYESESMIVNEDMLPSIKNDFSLEETMKEINELIGMKNIKEELKNLSKFLKYNKKLEKVTGFSKTLNLHMVFSGNAGTGKTTVARLLSDILFNMGYIEERKITEITPKDLIGEFTGQTAPKARKTIENALGGVLFIDEAYSLSNAKNGFGADAIVELLKCMEDYQDKIVIIFAGYHDEMNDFIDLNPGLKSRVRYNFEFEDYDEDELIEILKMKLRKLQMTIDDESIKSLKRIISFNKKGKNFGNGRYIDNLVNNLLIKHSLNINDNDDSNLLKITIDDVNLLSETNDIKINDVFSGLNKLIGLDNVKKELYQLVDYLEYNKKLEKYNIYPKNINLHMVFSGNAGTGKTTVARLLSDIFYSLGYIPENRLTEVTAKDLTGEYLGQTAPKVRRQVENALGGVLFIDEAYSLISGKSGYGDEAITELLVCMEKYYDRLIIVFSGYEKEMKNFINTNPGLKSRIGKSFIFEDYDVEELTQILLKLVNDNKLKITDSAVSKFKKLIEQAMKTKNFGNARFVRNTFDEILIKHSSNTKDTEEKEKLITITENDIDEYEIKKNDKSSKGKMGFNLNKKEDLNNNPKPIEDFKAIDNLEFLEEVK